MWKNQKWKQPLTHEKCSVEFDRSSVCPACKFYFTCLELPNKNEGDTSSMGFEGRRQEPKTHSSAKDKPAPVSEENSAKTVAVFGPTSGPAFSGRVLILFEQGFHIDGLGAIVDAQVVQYEQDGLLIWTDEEVHQRLMGPQAHAVENDSALAKAETTIWKALVIPVAIVLLFLAISYAFNSFNSDKQAVVTEGNSSGLGIYSIRDIDDGETYIANLADGGPEEVYVGDVVAYEKHPIIEDDNVMWIIAIIKPAQAR